MLILRGYLRALAALTRGHPPHPVFVNVSRGLRTKEEVTPQAAELVDVPPVLSSFTNDFRHKFIDLEHWTLAAAKDEKMMYDVRLKAADFLEEFFPRCHGMLIATNIIDATNVFKGTKVSVSVASMEGVPRPLRRVFVALGMIAIV